MMAKAKFVTGIQSCLDACPSVSLLILACLLPVAAQAQVSYTGTTANQNFGSQAIGSTSAAATFSFSVAAGTTVGSIAVVTTGIANLDFTEATGSTCAATTYASAATCTVDVTFTPKAAGLRMGAVVFFSAANNAGTVLGSVLIHGTGTGPQITYVPSSPAIAVATVGGGLAVDSAGDLFIADEDDSRVVEVPAGGGAAIASDPTVNGRSLSYPDGVAVDGAGDLFIADSGNSRVVEIPVGGGAAIAIDPVVNGVRLSRPLGVAVDAAGDLFIADEDNSRVVEIPAGGGAGIALDPVVNGQSLNLEEDVAVDGSGNLFIADEGNSRVVEIPAGGGAAIALDPIVNGLSLSNPTTLCVDGVGNLFVSDYGHSRIVEIPADGGAATVEFGRVQAHGVAVDGAGNLFVAERGYNPGLEEFVEEFERSQPPALSFPTPTAIGTTDTKDGTQTVQIQNAGNETLTLILSYPLDFSEASGDSNACTPSTSLSAGQQCDVPVEFTPETDGSLSENVTVTDNALNVTGPEQSITVTGTGKGADHLSVTATASVDAGIPFTITITGQSASDHTVTTYNGTVSFTSSDPGFVNPGPLTLSSGVGQATVTLKTFGTQTITATDTLSPSLTGSGSFAVVSAPPPPPPVTYTGTSANQNFGSQAIGSTSAARTLSFSVAAGTTVGSIGAVVLGSANLDFALATGSNCAVQDYTSPTTCTVNVAFTPRNPGLRMGALEFFSGANNTGTVLGGALLYGIGTGPDLAYGYSGVVLSEGTPGGPPYEGPGGWPTSPTALAVDGSGDLFVVGDGCSLTEVPAGGGNLIGIGTPGCVVALAFDGAGRLYQVDSNCNCVYGPSGPIAPLVDGEVLNGPSGIALDGEGDLFIVDGGNNRIVEVPAGGGAATAIAPTVSGKGLNGPSGLALDSSGDLFIADTNNSRIVEVPAGGGAATAIDVGCSALAVDAAGDLFIVTWTIVEVPAGGGAPFIFMNGDGIVDDSIDNAGGVAVDGAGDVFATFYSFPETTPPYYYQPISFLYEAQASRQAPTLNFPTLTNIDSIDTADGTQTVEVLNLGNQALNLAALSYPTDFPQASGDPNPCPVTISLSAGKSCDIPIEFAPKRAGTLSEDVTFTENSLNLTGTKQSIALSGTGSETPASITSPTSSSTLTGPSVTFTWTTVSGATSYDLWLGTTGVGSNNLWSSGSTTATSVTFGGLPSNGETIYARLWTAFGGVLVHADYTYTANSQAALTSPAPGSTFTGRSATFVWSPAVGATGYDLWLGTAGVGSNNLWGSGGTTATSVTFGGLPTNGEKIYARLFTFFNGVEVHTDCVYTAYTAGP